MVRVARVICAIRVTRVVVLQCLRRGGILSRLEAPIYCCTKRSRRLLGPNGARLRVGLELAAVLAAVLILWSIVTVWGQLQLQLLLACN